MSLVRNAVLTSVLLCSLIAAAVAAPTPPPTAQSPLPQSQPSLSPLTAAQLKDPGAALAAASKNVGAASWKKYGAVFLSGVAQVQKQLLPFTSATDLRTGYSRTIILLPHNAGTYEFGLDKDGGWTAINGRLRVFVAEAQNVKTALYVNRFGIFAYPGDPAAVKELGVDQTIGDRMTITPSGGVAVLAVLKPQTGLVSAVQFANGQADVYADYRPVAGLLFPFRMMQGADANALTVFQSSTVEFQVAGPDAASITRPALPIDTSTPQPAPSSSAVVK